jgi:hypothetical protein
MIQMPEDLKESFFISSARKGKRKQDVRMDQAVMRRDDNIR